MGTRVIQVAHGVDGFFNFFFNIHIFFFSPYRETEVLKYSHMATISSLPQCVSKYIIDQLPSRTGLCETLNGLSLLALLLISHLLKSRAACETN